MATKTISQLYLGVYAAIAARQHAKYGNPTADQSPAPSHVPTTLERAVEANIITMDHARKLAPLLGRKAYGEVGLTPGTVCPLIEQVCGFNGLEWHTKARLETSLCGY